MKNKITFFAFLVSMTLVSVGQTTLSKSEALAILMEKNFDLKVADLNIEIANNNVSLLNSGYLPTLSTNGNLNFNIDNSDLVLTGGADTTINNAQSDGRALNVNLNYVLFDGFNRKYNIKLNQENLTISQLNAQLTLESTLVNFYTSYYAVAQSQQSVISLKQSLDISKDRLRRLQYGFDYGRNTRIDVSNAEVDVNTDSINYLNSIQLLDNQIRNLNLLLSQESNIVYKVDTTLYFNDVISKNDMTESLLSANSQIQLAKAGVNVGTFNNQISKRNLLPTITLNSSYAKNVNNFAPGNFLVARSNSGIAYGASFTWNLFDGGSSAVSSQNTLRNVEIQKTLLQQTTQQVITNFDNNWANYQNQLFIIQAQQNNVEANKQNFDRTFEKYKLGQVSSLDFRTAQLNLIQAKLNLIAARYNAKLSEISVYQLAGKVQAINF